MTAKSETVHAAVEKMKGDIKEHLQTYCSELVQMGETGILPDGKVRTMARVIQPFFPYANDAMNIVMREVQHEAMCEIAKNGVRKSVMTLYRIRDRNTGLFGDGARRDVSCAKSKIFKKIGPVKCALRARQAGVAYDKKVYGYKERTLVPLPAELEVVEYHLFEVKATSANEILGLK